MFTSGNPKIRLVSHTHTHTIDVIVDVCMTSRDVIVGIRMTSLPVYGHTEWYTSLVNPHTFNRPFPSLKDISYPFISNQKRWLTRAVL